MKNSIEVSVAFSYRGVNYTPSAIVDLDEVMTHSGSLDDFHPTLAKLNGIDTYSYLYEVMESYALVFSNPTGLAMRCVHDGHFDIHAFEVLWQDEHELPVLNEIARKHLKITDLHEQEDVKQALLAAYRAGKSVGQKVH